MDHSSCLSEAIACQPSLQRLDTEGALVFPMRQCTKSNVLSCGFFGTDFQERHRFPQKPTGITATIHFGRAILVCENCFRKLLLNQTCLYYIFKTLKFNE